MLCAILRSRVVRKGARMIEPISLLQGVSLVEMVLYGFMAANMGLASIYILRRGFSKLAAARADG